MYINGYNARKIYRLKREFLFNNYRVFDVTTVVG